MRKEFEDSVGAREGISREFSFRGNLYRLNTYEYPEGELAAITLESPTSTPAVRESLRQHAQTISTSLQIGLSIGNYASSFAPKAGEALYPVHGVKSSGVSVANTEWHAVFQLLQRHYLPEYRGAVTPAKAGFLTVVPGGLS